MLKRFFGAVLCGILLLSAAGTAIAQDEDSFFRDQVVSKRDAVILSALFPGLGQMTQGQKVKGATMFLGEAVSLVLFINANENYNTKQNLYDRDMDSYKSLAMKQGSDADARALFNDLKDQSGDLDNLHTMRNTALIVAAGVWAYNLFDAIFVSQSTTESRRASADSEKLVVRSAMIDRNPGIMLSKRF